MENLNLVSSNADPKTIRDSRSHATLWKIYRVGITQNEHLI
jgi:hypothetical protein